ncbi:MAG: hypothetical protein ACR2HF_11080 [Methylococcaceae bacterium]
MYENKDAKIRTDFSTRLDWALTYAGVPEGKPRRAAVAKRFSVSVETARKWLSGLVLPDPWRILSIAGELEVCAEFLLTGQGPRSWAELNRIEGEYGFVVDPLPEDEINIIKLYRCAPPESRQLALQILETGERIRKMEGELMALREQNSDELPQSFA